MKTFLYTILTFLSVSQVFCQKIFTGSLMIDDATYSGVVGNLPQTSASSLPKSMDLSFYLPPPGDQGTQQSCVAWAIAYGAQAYYAIKSVKDWSYTDSYNNLNYRNLFSPSYIYNQINNSKDEGSNFIHALELLTKEGVCTWSSMPYNPKDFISLPSASAKNEAQNFKIERYIRLGERQSLSADIKEQLANSHPIIANVVSDENYLGNGYKNDKGVQYIWTRIGNHNPRLGHAILIVGYDDDRETFKFLNSYSDKWGTNGYGYISYSVVNGVVKNAFTIKPAFYKFTENDNQPVQQIIIANRTNLNEQDKAAGLNLSVNSVEHMHTSTHPGIHPSNMFMTIRGNLSIPANVGRVGQIIIYYHLVTPDGTRLPLPSSYPDFQLQSGQAFSSTPPLNVAEGIINLPWYSTIPYYTFPRYASYNTPPRTYMVEAEPMIVVDSYSFRIGSKFIFPVTL